VTEPIRLGTRGSQLARTQSATVGDALAAASGRDWHEVIVRTPGDDTSKPLDQPGSPGLFVSTLRQALRAGDVDVVVHSFKDLPSAPEPGLIIAAVPTRVDPRDALVSRDGLALADLPPGAVVGTSSPRRAATLLRLRPDLSIRPIRGNVDTRIRKVRAGEFDAAVLAVAGLQRLGRADEITEVLDAMVPAPAQGALAVECRADDRAMVDLLAGLDDAVSRLETAAERQVLVGIDAACTTAVAARATFLDGTLRLVAELTVDGHHVAADVVAACDPTDVAAARLAGMRGAAQLLGPGAPVLLVRSEGNETDSASLAAWGIPSISEPYVSIRPTPGGGGDLVASLRECASAGQAGQSWLVVTSPMAVPSWLTAAGEQPLREAVRTANDAGVRAAATGQRSADTLRALGFTDVVIPQESSAQGLVDELSSLPAGRAIFPRGNLAMRTLPDGLRARGWQVDEGVVYETAGVDERPVTAAMVEAGEFAAIVLRSPSAVRALVEFAQVPAHIPVVCGGATTADAARQTGLPVAAIASSPAPDDVARAVAGVIAKGSVTG
jgi:hydroxymethylbilane synthase